MMTPACVFNAKQFICMLRGNVKNLCGHIHLEVDHNVNIYNINMCVYHIWVPLVNLLLVASLNMY